MKPYRITPPRILTLPGEHESFMRQYMAKYPYADAENIALSLSRAAAMHITQARVIARAWFAEWERKLISQPKPETRGDR